MATARPFAYNPGSPISGTTQVGNLAIGFPTSGFTDSPQFWNGPDEELGYVIAQSVSGNTQPTPISGVFASVGFFRSSELTDASFINLTNGLFNQTFSDANSASSWLTTNGYWNSYTGTDWTLNFTGLDCNSITCNSNTQTVPENVTLYFLMTLDVDTNKPNWVVRKNGTIIFNSDGLGPLETTLSYNADDSIEMNLSSVNLATGTITIRQDNSSGRLIDSVPYSVVD